MPIKLRVQGQSITVDDRFANVSNFLKEAWEPGSDEELPLLESQVTLKAFQTLQKYYEFNNFEPAIIDAISNDPNTCFLNEFNRQLIMEYSVFEGNELKELLQAAIYLQTLAFKKLCLARIAFEFHVDKQEPNKSFNTLKEKFNMTNSALTLGDVERFKQEYPTIVNKYN
ncbi:unnamed protein product [Paramecium primaurelia]|uniref:Uncharacterized protein n=1 Tax=Paramecium primaurelia TaxID=5886 RepID=A0A8S1PVD8_PARPR|nr:unnamed protein product [Paramecium primaurelia]